MPNPLPPPIPQTVEPTRKRWHMGFGGFSRLAFSRPLGIVALVGVLLGTFVLPPTGINISTCGFQTSTGLPCVGCGLTRSVTSFLQGHFGWAMAYHPFGPVFALTFVLMAVTAVLPGRFRDPLLRRLEPWDRVLGIGTVAFFVLLILYGIFRISMVAAGHPDLEWWISSEVPPGVPGS